MLSIKFASADAHTPRPGGALRFVVLTAPPEAGTPQYQVNVVRWRITQ
jgi:hypothetical protein